MASIVVIDSEVTVRSVMVTILQGAGYTVRATGEFDNAVEWIRESTPDLVITNVFLRGIAGHDAMKKLRSEFQGLPVLMVSAAGRNTHQGVDRRDGLRCLPKAVPQQCAAE
jgi:DNA-binding NtrC family response regulator